MTCPIGLDKIHCDNCYFWRNGKCDYNAIMREHRRKANRRSDTKMLSPFSTEKLKADLRRVRAVATVTQYIVALYEAPMMWVKDPELLRHYEYDMGVYNKMGPLLVKYMHTLEQEIESRAEKPARWTKPDWLEKYPVEKILPSEIVELRNLFNTNKELMEWGRETLESLGLLT